MKPYIPIYNIRPNARMNNIKQRISVQYLLETGPFAKLSSTSAS